MAWTWARADETSILPFPGHLMRIFLLHLPFFDRMEL
jgi:hypothetical protein